jgi:heme/copper-type cytochrome/quinol oxidase subunit 2
MLGAVIISLFAPLASAQSPEANAEWALFNQILIIGIVVGVVVFGLMFYAIIRYREASRKDGTN